MKLTILFTLLFPVFVFAQQPTVLDIFNNTPYTDENDVTLEDGDVIHVIWAGPDNVINSPILTIGEVNSGQPTGDDQLLEVHAVGENYPPGFGQFSFSISAYPAGDPQSRRPQVDDRIYVRAFNTNNTQTATYYGDAQLYIVQGVNGEDYDPLIDMGSTDSSLPVELSSFTAVGGNKEVVLEWATESELNNIGFIISRSTSEDGVYKELDSYKTLKELKGAGSITTQTTYHYVDGNLINETTYWYKLYDVHISGKVNELKTISAIPNADNDNYLANYIPEQYLLKQNYPNPFNPETKIEIQVPEDEKAGFTQVSVYNAVGQKIRTLFNGQLNPGIHFLIWDGKSDAGSGMPSGIYFYSVKNNRYSEIKKMLLVR